MNLYIQIHTYKRLKTPSIRVSGIIHQEFRNVVRCDKNRPIHSPSNTCETHTYTHSLSLCVYVCVDVFLFEIRGVTCSRGMQNKDLVRWKLWNPQTGPTPKTRRIIAYRMEPFPIKIEPSCKLFDLFDKTPLSRSHQQQHTQYLSICWNGDPPFFSSITRTIYSSIHPFMICPGIIFSNPLFPFTTITIMPAPGGYRQMLISEAQVLK